MTGRYVRSRKDCPELGLLTWILVGRVARLDAEAVVGGGLNGVGLRRLILAVLLGIGGAILGGFVASAAGWGDVTGSNVRSLVIASLGAIAVVLVWHALSSKKGLLA